MRIKVLKIMKDFVLSEINCIFSKQAYFHWGMGESWKECIFKKSIFFWTLAKKNGEMKHGIIIGM